MSIHVSKILVLAFCSRGKTYLYLDDLCHVLTRTDSTHETPTTYRVGNVSIRTILNVKQ
jgi:hypothetical protein